MKRIRKHIVTNGVTPRVHGNHGKKPHNRFSLDIYQQATAFLQSYIERARNRPANGPSSSVKTKLTGNGRDKSAAGSQIVLPADVTCKTVHSAYKEYMEHFEPGSKWLGYSTFRHFMKRQFPLVKFSVSAASPELASPHRASATKNLTQTPPVVASDQPTPDTI